MKKFCLVALILLSLIFSIDAQTRSRWTVVEEYLHIFEVDLKVWFDDETHIFTLEDASSRSFDEMLFQWTYAMQAIDFMLTDRGIRFEVLQAEKFLYVWFQPTAKYEITMTKEWLSKYFDPETNRKDRSDMIVNLYNEYYKKWSAALKRKF